MLHYLADFVFAQFGRLCFCTLWQIVFLHYLAGFGYFGQPFKPSKILWSESTKITSGLKWAMQFFELKKATAK